MDAFAALKEAGIQEKGPVLEIYDEAFMQQPPHLTILIGIA
jgi:hypothetical protein